jgi:hypothetical protein
MACARLPATKLGKRPGAWPTPIFANSRFLNCVKERFMPIYGGSAIFCLAKDREKPGQDLQLWAVWLPLLAACEVVPTEVLSDENWNLARSFFVGGTRHELCRCDLF